MDKDETITTYETGGDCLGQIENALNNWNEAKSKADKGRSKVSGLYSKEHQWAMFEQLLGRL
jgi:hypothetical protein